MWRPRGFRTSLLTTSRLQHAGKKGRRMEEWKVRGAIKKQVGSEAIYPEISCSLVTINVRGFCTAFLRCKERNRLIVAPDYDDLRKSTRSLKRGLPSRTTEDACDFPLYLGQVRFMNGIALFTPLGSTLRHRFRVLGGTPADECATARASQKKLASLDIFNE
jgi:hypothetical protein